MSELLLKKYAARFERLDILDRISPASPSGAYILFGEDADVLNVVARIVAARVAGLPVERTLGDLADIAVYPAPPEKSKSDKSDAKNAAVTVEDIKSIVNGMYLTPFELDKKFFIIQNADSMSEICQNKLLKSLEEPPRSVCFILCACRALLPTVESRCTAIRIPPLGVGETIALLSPFHKDKAAVELAGRASMGNIGLAERILADKDFTESYKAAKLILENCTGSRNFAVVSGLYDKFTRDKVRAVLDVMEYLVSDVAKLLSGEETVFAKSDAESVSRGFTAYSAARSADFVREAKRKNDGNCMPVAVMDDLILKIMEEKALCLR